MAYIGRDTDKISNVEVLDNITFDGSSSYTLQKNSVNFTPSSANTLLVSIDGVVQAGNFTVSGSTIDFGTAVAGTSTCDFILHYGVGLITTPADGTVTTDKIGSNAVTSAKITYPLTTFSSTGIDDNATSTAITIDSSEVVRLPVGILRLQNATTGTADTDGLLIEASGNDVYINNKENADMYFRTNNTDRLLIDSVGNLKASRNGAALNANSTHQLIDAGANSYSLMLSNKAASPASQYMLEIGFKGASPDNSAAKFIEANDTTTTRFRVNSNGDCQNHDNSYGAISDERVKQDIVDAGSQWEDIKNIRVRKYKKKHDVIQYGEENAPTEIGVISQELETVSPKLIKEDKADSSHAELHEDFTGENPQNVKYVKYSILYMKSIKALQEAMERIETLEAKVTALENK